jgi:hypothetical protein
MRLTSGRCCLTALLGLMLVAGQLSAQEETAPEPYAPAEFGPGLRAIRRGEILAVGVFPLALLVSRIAYDYGRWAFDGFEPATSPLVRPLGVDPFPDEADRIAVAVAAVGVSVVFALVDYLIGLGEAPASESGLPPPDA